MYLYIQMQCIWNVVGDGKCSLFFAIQTNYRSSDRRQSHHKTDRVLSAHIILHPFG